MALRLHDPGFGMARTLVSALPAVVAVAATIVVARDVFPAQPGVGMALVALAWTGAMGGVLAGRLQRRPAQAAETPLALIDPETGLGNARHLAEVLHREVARSARYGSPLTVCLFEAGIAGFRATAEGELAPSPARFIAQALVNIVRESDTVHRLDQRRFVVVLPECGPEGAATIIARVRTQLSMSPYARNADESAIYARAWGAACPWQPDYADEDAYLRATFAAFDASRVEYRAAASFFEAAKS